VELIRSAATSGAASDIIHAKAMQDEQRSQEWALVSRAREGDLSAFEALYRRYVRRIYALCLRLSGDTSLAEDLTQEAFVRAWKKMAQFRGESAFSTWLHPLAVNVVLAERRSRRSRDAHTFLTDDVSSHERPTAGFGPEVRLDIERAVASLPAGARAVFVLHDIEGYRHEEIAEMTGVTIGTSKAQLHRARQLLKERLAP
jgi:RNA polymerase sigma-70 factor (ECF subfamily)